MRGEFGLNLSRPYRPLLAGVFWPSTALIMPWERAPKFAGAPAGVDSDADAWRRELEDLAAYVDDADREEFYALTQGKDLSQADAARLADIIAKATERFDQADIEIAGAGGAPSAAELLARARRIPGTPEKTGRPGTFGFATTTAAGPQAAFSLSDLDPRKLVRVATVLQMKDRAAQVGARGVGPLLRAILEADPDVRVHLIGHSYGAIVVLSAVCFPPEEPLPAPVDSMLLLQPAVSQWCFAADVAGKGFAGGYRPALERVRRPIFTTFTRRDAPLTKLFHLAVRRDEDLGQPRIAGGGLPKPPSMYAALGGFGPAGLSDVELQVLQIQPPSTRYSLGTQQPRVCALNGDAMITSHGDVSVAGTWWALFQQLDSSTWQEQEAAMTELIKSEVSLAVLKVRLLEASADSVPAAGVDATANQTLTPRQRIFCELQVTGNAEERGLLAPTAQTTDRASRRRGGRSVRYSYEALEGSGPGSLSRTLAQWSFAPEEMQLPVQYRDAVLFRDRPGIAGRLLADAARFTASKLLNEFLADALERFAAAKSWLPCGEPTLPSTMMRQLQLLLPSIMRAGDSLWLELAEPTGYLPLLPWEEMLRPATDAPILRLSPHALQALSPDRELSVLLCLTAPSEAWAPTRKQLAALANAIRSTLPQHSTIHVFADDLCHANFAAAQERVASDDRDRTIRLHDLPGASSDPEARDASWRLWVTKALAGRAADIVHCMAPGMLFPDDARLLIAREPAPPRKPTSRLIGARGGRPLRYLSPFELSEWLSLSGAWGAVFSTPARGGELVEARMGLRLFVDQIGRLRPGVAAFHNWQADPDCTALAGMYRFTLGNPSGEAMTSTSVSLYYHPGRTAPVAAGAPMTIPGEVTRQYAKVKETVEAVAASGPLPTWVAATQRIVEHTVSRAATLQTMGSDDAAVRGLVSALKYVEQMIAERARTPQSQASAEAPSVQKGANANG